MLHMNDTQGTVFIVEYIFNLDICIGLGELHLLDMYIDYEKIRGLLCNNM